MLVALKPLARFLVCIIVLGVLGSCEPKANVPEEYRAVLEMPLGSEQGDAIRRFQPRDQIRIYLIAMRTTRPPRIGLAWYVASSGEAVITPLIEAVQNPASDFDVRDLILVAEIMTCEHRIPIREDSVVATLALAAARLRIRGARDAASRLLDRLRTCNSAL
jgi:hypothetical protein